MHVVAGGARGVGREADGDDLRVGEADGGDRDGVEPRRWPAMISATIAPCAMARCASIGSPVRSPTAQTLSIDVAQRSSIAHEGAVHREVEPVEAEAGGAGAPPRGDEDLVGRGCSRSRRRLLRDPSASPASERPEARAPVSTSTPNARRRRATGRVSSAS